ncbi:MAG: LPS export ABC transporter periplasmic protein LptC [Bacteroidota bacterium]|nr:LPS export ABC transporter periplasmic protein LptC [Bacteroidota bacterium]
MLQDWNEKKIMVEEAKNIVTYLSQQGHMKAKLTSPLMLRYLADTIYAEFPKTLHVDFYDDSTKIESQLNAEYGKYFESLNKVYLRDSVIVYNIKGDTLRCPELWWDEQQQKFYNDKPTKIDTKTEHLYGKNGIEANQDFSIIILNQPTGTVQIKDIGFPK